MWNESLHIPKKWMDLPMHLLSMILDAIWCKFNIGRSQARGSHNCCQLGWYARINIDAWYVKAHWAYIIKYVVHIKDSGSKQPCDVLMPYLDVEKAQSSLVDERGAHEGLVTNGRIGD